MSVHLQVKVLSIIHHSNYYHTQNTLTTTITQLPMSDYVNYHDTLHRQVVYYNMTIICY